MKIAVLDDYQDAFRNVASFRQLQDHEVVVFHDTEKDPAKLAERLRDVNIIVLTQQRSSLSRAVIERLHNLKLVAQTGRNASHIDIRACTEKGIIVSVGGASPPHSTAELAWGLILSSVRHIPHEVQQLKQGVWQTTVGTSLYRKTLGIYAFGRIGSCVAQVGKAFGMRVMCWGREASKAKALEAGFAVAENRRAFFEDADVLSLHIPLNEETRGIITAADLASMKPTALIVNTSRAGLIAGGVLVEALQNGRPGFAAVDVYEEEPVIGGNHPLLRMRNTICTPHLGYVEKENYEGYYGAVADAIVGYAAGRPINVLNPEALSFLRSRSLS